MVFKAYFLAAFLSLQQLSAGLPSSSLPISSFGRSMEPTKSMFLPEFDRWFTSTKEANPERTSSSSPDRTFDTASGFQDCGPASAAARDNSSGTIITALDSGQVQRYYFHHQKMVPKFQYKDDTIHNSPTRS
jgi:hypothetical protein